LDRVFSSLTVKEIFATDLPQSLPCPCQEHKIVRENAKKSSGQKSLEDLNKSICQPSGQWQNIVNKSKEGESTQAGRLADTFIEGERHGSTVPLLCAGRIIFD